MKTSEAKATKVEQHLRPLIEAVPCEGCSQPTLMTGTRLCDGCHEASKFLDLPQAVQERLKAYKEKRGG